MEFALEIEYVPPHGQRLTLVFFQFLIAARVIAATEWIFDRRCFVGSAVLLHSTEVRSRYTCLGPSLSRVSIDAELERVH